MTPYIIVVLVNIATSFFKKVVFPKFGATGVQVILFVLSMLAAFVVYYNGINPSFAHVAGIAVKIFMSAIVLYEVLLKKFDVFAPKAE